jgi:hypothetical protein
MEKKRYMIAYFPYLSMGNMDEIDLGFAQIWNFYKKNNDYIKDERVRSQLKLIFKMHRGHEDPISGIGVICLGVSDCRIFSDDEIKKIRDIQNLLFLGYVSEYNTEVLTSNSGHSMYTSDNFDVFLQNFVLEDDYVSERTGVIVPKLEGGWTTSELIIKRPTYVLTSSGNEPDWEFIKQLQVLEKKRPTVFKRIMGATEIFMESYYNSPILSQNARILLITSAFEIMLNLRPGLEARKEFKKYIGDNFVLSGEKDYEYVVRGIKNKRTVTLKKKQIWADKLFTLRNDIAHGRRIDKRRYRFNKYQSHLHISLLFFLLFIRKQIEKSIKIPCDIQIKWRDWTDEFHYPRPVRCQILEYDRLTAPLERLLMQNDLLNVKNLKTTSE